MTSSRPAFFTLSEQVKVSTMISPNQTSEILSMGSRTRLERVMERSGTSSLTTYAASPSNLPSNLLFHQYYCWSRVFSVCLDATRRATVIATYSTPVAASSVAIMRAAGFTATTSPYPNVVSVVRLK